ncbi:MAG: hypothetical protein WDW36_004919 [Sanguina aurantia]
MGPTAKHRTDALSLRDTCLKQSAHQHASAGAGSAATQPPISKASPPWIPLCVTTAPDDQHTEDSPTVCMASPPSLASSLSPHTSHPPSHPTAQHADSTTPSSHSACRADSDSDPDLPLPPPPLGPELTGCDSPIITSSRSAGRAAKGSPAPSARRPSIFRGSDSDPRPNTADLPTTPPLQPAKHQPQTPSRTATQQPARSSSGEAEAAAAGKLCFVTAGDDTGPEFSSPSPPRWKSTGGLLGPLSPRVPASPDSPADALRSSLAGWIHRDAATATAGQQLGGHSSGSCSPPCAQPRTSTDQACTPPTIRAPPGACTPHQAPPQAATATTLDGPPQTGPESSAPPTCSDPLGPSAAAQAGAPGSWRAAATRASTRMTPEELASFDDEPPNACAPIPLPRAFSSPDLDRLSPPTQRRRSLGTGEPQLGGAPGSPARAPGPLPPATDAPGHALPRPCGLHAAAAPGSEMDHEAIFLVPTPPDATHPHPYWSPSSSTTPRGAGRVSRGSHLPPGPGQHHPFDGADVEQQLLQPHLLHSLLAGLDPCSSMDATSQLLYPASAQAVPASHPNHPGRRGTVAEQAHAAPGLWGEALGPLQRGVNTQVPAHSFSLDMSQLLQGMPMLMPMVMPMPMQGLESTFTSVAAAPCSTSSNSSSGSGDGCEVPSLPGLILTPIRTAATESPPQPPSLDSQQRAAAAAATAGLWTPPASAGPAPCDPSPRRLSCPNLPHLTHTTHPAHSATSAIHIPSSVQDRRSPLLSPCAGSPSAALQGHSPLRASDLFTRLPRIRTPTTSMSGTPDTGLDLPPQNACSTPRKDSHPTNGIQHCLATPDTAAPQPGALQPLQAAGTAERQPSVARPQQLAAPQASQLPGYPLHARPMLAQYHSQPGGSLPSSLLAHNPSPALSQGPHSHQSAATPRSTAPRTAPSTLLAATAAAATVMPMALQRAAAPSSAAAAASSSAASAASAAGAGLPTSGAAGAFSARQPLQVSPLRGAGGPAFGPPVASRRPPNVAGGFRVRDRRSLVARYVDVFAVDQRR